MFHQDDVFANGPGSDPVPGYWSTPPSSLSCAAPTTGTGRWSSAPDHESSADTRTVAEVDGPFGAHVVTYELVAMDGHEWFCRNRGGGWRTLIDVETGRATQETCFVEDHLFEHMLLSGRASTTPVEAATVAARHPWFVGTNPVRREPTGCDASNGAAGMVSAGEGA